MIARLTAEILDRHKACEEKERFRQEWPNGWIPNRLEAMAAWDRYDWNWAAEHLLIGRYLDCYVCCREQAKQYYIQDRRKLNASRKAGEISWQGFDQASKNLRRAYRENLAVAFAEAMEKQKEIEG
ncbi:MAG: hypothetical protein KGJ13_09445 [Patescibacteria group bacterium]|nr:hypothetical protein [Patescibacteria group bacterium]